MKGMRALKNIPISLLVVQSQLHNYREVCETKFPNIPSKPGPYVINLFFMLSSAKHKI